MFRALGSVSCDIIHGPGNTNCYGHWGSVSCDILHETRGTSCYGHWVLRLVIYDKRDRKYDLLRALGSASCDIIHGPGSTSCYGHWGSASCDVLYETGDRIYYGHWVVRLVIAPTRQEVRLVRGIGF